MARKTSRPTRRPAASPARDDPCALRSRVTRTPGRSDDSGLVQPPVGRHLVVQQRELGRLRELQRRRQPRHGCGQLLGNAVTVMMGNGRRHVRVRDLVPGSAGSRTHFVDVGDFNADGKDDIVATVLNQHERGNRTAQTPAVSRPLRATGRAGSPRPPGRRSTPTAASRTRSWSASSPATRNSTWPSATSASRRGPTTSSAITSPIFQGNGRRHVHPGPDDHQRHRVQPDVHRRRGLRRGRGPRPGRGRSGDHRRTRATRRSTGPSRSSPTTAAGRSPSARSTTAAGTTR